MNKRWFRFLFALLLAMTAALLWQLVAVAQATAAVSLMLDLLTVLNGLLIVALFFVLSRNLVKVYLERKGKRPGFRLKSKLVLALLPLTLLPALMMFFFASRLPEQILSGLSLDANIEQLIENSRNLNASYIEDLERMHVAAGPAVAQAVRAGDPGEIEAILQRFVIAGVVVSNRPELSIYFSDRFPVQKRQRLNDIDLSFTGQRAYDDFDDGISIWRFPYQDGDTRLQFLYVKDTQYTERLAFVAESYAALDLLRRKKETVSGLYQSTLTIVTLSVIFGGIWMGLTFARKFIDAFNRLSRGAEEVGKGNFDTFIDLKTGDEIENVVDAFNTMTRTLKTNQHELKQKATDLERVNQRLATQMEYTETLLNEVNTGILSTDAAGFLRTWNPAASQLLEIDDAFQSAPFLDVLDDARHGSLRAFWHQFQKGRDRQKSSQLELRRAEDGTIRQVHATLVALAGEESAFGTLLVMEDLTPLVNAQRLAAWREVAQRVAHEIKNPLTPIQLSTQRIQRKAEQQAPDLAKAVLSAHETIMSEIDILKNLVNEFSTFAKLPTPSKERVDIALLVKNVGESYAVVYPDLKLQIRSPDHPIWVQADPAQIRQVLSNLVNNAAHASPDKGTIMIELEVHDSEVSVSVRDQGPGIRRSEREKIFIPYYSKSPKGTGLGLAIVNRIVEDHGGSVSVHANQPKGAVFTVRLPSDQPAGDSDTPQNPGPPTAADDDSQIPS